MADPYTPPVLPWRFISDPKMQERLNAECLQNLSGISKVTKENVLEVFRVLVDVGLRWLGFKKVGANSYFASSGESIRFELFLDGTQTRMDAKVFKSYKNTEERVFDSTDLDPVPSFLNLPEDISEQYVQARRSQLHTAFMKCVTLAQRGCLFIIGDELGSHYMKFCFQEDRKILEHASKTDPNVKSSQKLFQARYSEDLNDGIENFVSTSATNELVEWVILNNQPKHIVKDAVQKFFAAGYRYSHLVVAAHGDEETGNFILEIPDESDELTPLKERSVSYNELKEWIDTSSAFLHGTPGDGVINTCFSHKFLPAHPWQTDRGFRLYAVTSEDAPLAPPHFAELQKSKDTFIQSALRDFLPKNIDWAQYQSDPDTLARQYFPNQQPYYSLKSPQPILTEVLEPGLYMFPAGRGDTYVLLCGRRALLIDSGMKPELFANCCWNKFMAKYVDEFDALITHVDQDHIQGLLYLVHHNDFGPKMHPKWKRLWINCPSTKPTRASYSDAQNILSKIAKAKVDVKKATAGDLLEVFDDLEIKVLSPRKDDKTPDGSSLKKMLQKWEDTVGREWDKSISNVSSIVLKVTHKKTKWNALLCADNRQDVIVDCLKAEQQNAPFVFNVVTLPHHGSHHNSDEKFGSIIKAKHYLISADGFAHKGKEQYGHPNSKALKHLPKDAKISTPYAYDRPDTKFHQSLQLQKGANDSNSQSPWIHFSFDN